MNYSKLNQETNLERLRFAEFRKLMFMFFFFSSEAIQACDANLTRSEIDVLYLSVDEDHNGMYALVTFENPYLLQKPVFTTHEINVLFRSVDEHHYGHAQNLIYYTYLQHITYTFLQGIKRGADENHHVQNRIYYTYLQHILCVQEGVRTRTPSCRVSRRELLHVFHIVMRKNRYYHKCSLTIECVL